jgi:DNA repair photolyase
MSGDWPEPDEPSSPRTQFIPDHARTVLTSNDSPDIPFSASVNPYRGCEHGCAYCYARPTHEYLGYSAGVDFETRILVKEKAPELLRESLLKPKYKAQVINLSGVTDCYQPIERKLRLTRRCLETLAEFGNPFMIITKNFGVTRDLDVIAPMAAENKAAVFITVTTLDDALCSVLEPRTSRPKLRLEAIRRLSQAGVPVGVMVAPVIPGLTDSELPAILEAAYDAGARHSAFTPLRLPLTVAPVFTAWLEAHYPDRKDKVLHRIQSMRDGKLNDARFGHRMQGHGVFADQLSQIHALWSRKLGLNRERLELSTEGFRRPGEQMSLLP